MSLSRILDGKVCIVVGASSPKGIGDATVRMFLDHGAKVVAAGIVMNDDIVTRLLSGCTDSEIPPSSIVGQICDITDFGQCQALMEAVVDKFGKVDCLVNCAGIVEGCAFNEISSDKFDRMTNVNLKGTFNLCKAALEQFEQQGHGNIVNLSSLAAQRGGGLAGGAHYAASKGGVISLTRSIAREYGPMNIRANTICPAMIDTDMLDGFSPERQKEIVESIPLRRVGFPSEVAGTCLFLASDLSGFVTGATIDVNGGAHIH
jgi:NAD(P)-dependent dehydrogenase (short-subunit alcohol dehydrogenase family)